MIRYHARWLFPVTAPPVEHGTVAVSGRRIAYVGARGGAPPGVDVDLGEVALLPGLVDAHSRLELTASRGALARLPFFEAERAFAAARRGPLTREALTESARLGVAEGVAAGTTTFGDSAATTASLAALRERHARGIVYCRLTGPDPAADRAAAIADLAARVAALRAEASDLVQVGVAPHSVFAVHEDLLIDACAYALGQRLPLAIHVAQSAAEIAFLREGDGPYADALRSRGVAVERRAYSPVHLLLELGIDIAAPLLVHGTRLDPTDVAFAAERGCPVVHCPTADAALGNGIAPVAELLAAGAVVGLGTGGAPAGGPGHLIDEARAAALLQRGRHADAGALTAAQALELATIGGARALGIAHLVGSLDVGKEADLSAFAIDGPFAERARDDPAAAVVFALAGRAAAFVAVAGRPLVRDGALLALP